MCTECLDFVETNISVAALDQKFDLTKQKTKQKQREGESILCNFTPRPVPRPEVTLSPLSSQTLEEKGDGSTDNETNTYKDDENSDNDEPSLQCDQGSPLEGNSFSSQNQAPSQETDEDGDFHQEKKKKCKRKTAEVKKTC